MDTRKSDIRSLQRVLKEKNLLTEEPSGDVTDGTVLAVDQYLSDNAGVLTLNFAQLSVKRRVVAALQIACSERGFDPGPFDGYYGPLTQHAATLLFRDLNGIIITDFDDIEPIDINPNDFPKETTAAISAHYGTLASNCQDGGIELTRVDCPWRMKLDWDMSLTRSNFNVHVLVADSLSRVVNKIFDHYGLEEIQRLGLHRFSGDYNPRRKRGGSRCSTHAWGIAIDFYGSKNELRRSTADTPPPTLAHPDLNFWWQAWEEEGWYSLGRMGDFDWMHVQAAKGRASRFHHA